MSDSFDVFLSHNSQDKPVVRDLAQALKSRRLRVWLDEEQLVPGRPWQEALETIIQSTCTAAVLIGKSGLGPWEEPEMRACLNQFVNRKLPVIPVLLPNAPAKPDLPLFLQVFTWVDLRDGLTDQGLDKLQWGITGIKPEKSPGQVEAGLQPPAKLIESANQGNNSAHIYSVSDDLVLEVRVEIGKLFRKSSVFQDIGKSLLGKLSGSKPSISPEEFLTPTGAQSFPVIEKIDGLHDAVRDTFSAMAESQMSSQITQAVPHAKKMLEWLLLLAVPDAWAFEGGVRSGAVLSQPKIDIPEKYAIWAEVGDGRLARSRPCLELEPGKDAVKVYAPNQLPHDDLEKGLTHRDALTETLRMIWIKVMKKEPSDSENWQAQLPQTLARRHKDGERYHITIPHGRYAAIAANPIWAEKLRGILSHLGIFVYDTGHGNPVLIVPEDDLLVAIREYLRLLRRYE